MSGAKAWTRPLRQVFGWLAGRPSLMLLTASDERLAQAPPGRFAFAWVGLLSASLAWGALTTVLWGAAWFVFTEPAGVLFTPVAVTAAAILLGPFRRAAVALAEALVPRDATARALAVSVVAAVLILALLGVRTHQYHSENLLPGWLAWVRPVGEPHRVLLLMPLWGGWAMLIAGQLARVNEQTEPAVRAFVRGCGPVSAAGSMALPAALTWLEFQFLSGWEWTIAGTAALVGILAGGLLPRLTGGLKRRSLLAVNLATQLAFLLAYLANR